MIVLTDDLNDVTNPEANPRFFTWNEVVFSGVILELRSHVYLRKKERKSQLCFFCSFITAEWIEFTVLVSVLWNGEISLTQTHTSHITNQRWTDTCEVICTTKMRYDWRSAGLVESEELTF